jgi:hypothetical protein
MLFLLRSSSPVSTEVKSFSEEPESVEALDSNRGEAPDSSAEKDLRGPKSQVVSLSLSL